MVSFSSRHNLYNNGVNNFLEEAMSTENIDLLLMLAAAFGYAAVFLGICLEKLDL